MATKRAKKTTPTVFTDDGTPDKRIVILQNGWIFLGIYHPVEPGARKDGFDRPAHLTEAHNIKEWDVTTGLGHIAMVGLSAPGTKYDECGVVAFENHEAIIATIKCSPAA